MYGLLAKKANLKASGYGCPEMASSYLFHVLDEDLPNVIVKVAIDVLAKQYHLHLMCVSRFLGQLRVYWGAKVL